MMKIFEKTQKGAASIYIIVVTALLFGIITVGFVGLVMNDLGKSSENSLSQSAYDSALAGVEDAKLAISKYRECVANSSSYGNCSELTSIYENSDKDCNAIAKMLDRIDPSTNDDVLIREDSTGTADTQQAYTCVKINSTPDDYVSTLDPTTNPIRVVPLSTDRPQDIQSVKISWKQNGTGSKYLNVDGDGIVNFVANNEYTPDPAVLAVQLYQYSSSFEIDDFKNSDIANNRTNRGTLWLVPQESSGTNKIDAEKWVDSNNHGIGHVPNLIQCNSGADYTCVVTIDLPPTKDGGGRSGTPLLVVNLPYGSPKTDFKVEMYNNAGDPLQFKNAQIVVDSTGRTNDIYRRVEARVEFTDATFPYPEYALELSGSGESGTSLQKN